MIRPQDRNDLDNRVTDQESSTAVLKRVRRSFLHGALRVEGAQETTPTTFKTPKRTSRFTAEARTVTTRNEPLLDL